MVILAAFAAHHHRALTISAPLTPRPFGMKRSECELVETPFIAGRSHKKKQVYKTSKCSFALHRNTSLWVVFVFI